MRVAIIPARGGSKRIPRKNIEEFCGKPMIAWPIEVAKASGLFDHIVVSTDDDEIGNVAKAWGAELPFLRPAALSDDHASTDRVVLHAVEESEKCYGKLDQACCIYPTSPFLTADDLRRGLHMLLEHAACTAFPLVKYDFPIEQAFLLEGARPCAKWPEQLDLRSQDLRDHYHDAGMFYWFDVHKFLEKPQLFAADSVAFEIPATHCQDINTAEDWEYAEMKFELLAAQSERRKRGQG